MKARLIATMLLLTEVAALAGALVSTRTALAREGLKHPRVAELEEHLKTQAQTDLTARFPNQPHSVLVSVDALFRYEPDDYSDEAARGEDLPGLYVNKEEMRDEWDDPNTSLLQLMSRVRKIKVEIALPDNVNDDDAEELRASILAALKMVSGRDTVDIIRKPWKGTDVSLAPTAALYGGALVLLLILGQLLISMRSASKLASAMSSPAAAQNSGGGGGVTNVQVAANVAGGGDTPRAAGGPAQDVNMVDPVKLRDLIAGHVGALQEDPSFPYLEDMLILDETGKRSGQRLALIVEEFSPEMKNRVFSLGTGQPWWIDSFYGASGQVDYEALMALQRLARVKRQPADAAWQHLLINVWRMEDKISAFVREIGEKRAVPILASFPKSIAVPAAKKAFPGSWGILLNPALPEDRLPEKDIVELTERAEKFFPLREPSVLLTYKKERELLSYLDRVDPKEEEEIYVALPESSNVSRLRPPFFRLLNQDKEVIRKVMKKLSLEQIALCAFAVDSTQRMKLLEVLNEKQSFMVTERVTKFDKNAPEIQALADTKKRAGLLLEETLAEIKMAREQGAAISDASAEDGGETGVDEGGDDQQAA